VLDLLEEINRDHYMWVELGLQSTHNETLKAMNTCYTYGDYEAAAEALISRGIRVVTHLILGLPGETQEMMLESARQVADLRPDMVKLHLLHILKDTALENIYLSGEYATMEREDYIDTEVRQIEMFHEDTVIARITGDAPADSLVAPEWCRKKTAVANDIDKEMFSRNTYQGRACRKI
jgi:radical SAM protein (TIGR01212 family)